MGSESYISASGASAQLRDLDVVANNLSNVGTPGYKRSQSIFRAVLESSLREEAGQLVPGAPSTAFVATDEIGANFERGSVERTGSPLHAMINGPGFFEILTPQGLRYTRAGNFIVNTRGELSTPSGYPVQGEGGTIEVRDSASRIDQTGAIVDSTGNVLGRLKIADFGDLQSLVREGQSVFSAPEEANLQVLDKNQFIPGSIEGSNVDASRELATMVMLQRAFETNVRAMQVDDETTQRLIEGMR
ncbi:MAG: flagellar basal-body rod protein FlgF [Deltaproteobacteria bacterium]|nr:flagellar basal-body rod protein FlgF [Deltaproteobacteria bacterium]